MLPDSPSVTQLFSKEVEHNSQLYLPVVTTLIQRNGQWGCSRGIADLLESMHWSKPSARRPRGDEIGEPVRCVLSHMNDLREVRAIGYVRSVISIIPSSPGKHSACQYATPASKPNSIRKLACIRDVRIHRSALPALHRTDQDPRYR